MKVEEIMTRSPGCCTPDMGLQEVAQLMVEHDCGEIPVCDASRTPIGTVTDRDIVCRLVAKGKNPLEMRAEDCMSSPVITARPDTSMEEASRLMEQYLVRRLPVVDGSGAICGMIAQGDIARKAPRQVAIEVVEKISEPNVMASSVGGRH